MRNIIFSGTNSHLSHQMETPFFSTRVICFFVIVFFSFFFLFFLSHGLLAKMKFITEWRLDDKTSWHQKQQTKMKLENRIGRTMRQRKRKTTTKITGTIRDSKRKTEQRNKNKKREPNSSWERTRPIAISRVLTLKNRLTFRLCIGWHSCILSHLHTCTLANMHICTYAHLHTCTFAHSKT